MKLEEENKKKIKELKKMKKKFLNKQIEMITKKITLTQKCIP